MGVKLLLGLLKIKGSSNSQLLLITQAGHCLCACTFSGRLAPSCTGADIVEGHPHLCWAWSDTAVLPRAQ